MKPRTSFQDLCYGIPVDLIATWCCVDIQSARHYKAGTRSPNKASRKLFALHLEGAVLPPEWQGFSFRAGVLYDPYGKPLTQGVLRAYQIGLQLMREWARGDAVRNKTLDDVFNMAHPLPRLVAASARERSDPQIGDEAKPSDFVRIDRTETVRRRNRQRSILRSDPSSLETGSTRVEGRSESPRGTPESKADAYAALSPHLRAAANAGAAS
jgi:hypothetical protein